MNVRQGSEISRLLLLALAGASAFGLAVLLRELPDIRRYLRIRRM